MGKNPSIFSIALLNRPSTKKNAFPSFKPCANASLIRYIQQWFWIWMQFLLARKNFKPNRISVISYCSLMAKLEFVDETQVNCYFWLLKMDTSCGIVITAYTNYLLPELLLSNLILWILKKVVEWSKKPVTTC